MPTKTINNAVTILIILGFKTATLNREPICPPINTVTNKTEVK
jgi:hypothetical protein